MRSFKTFHPTPVPRTRRICPRSLPLSPRDPLVGKELFHHLNYWLTSSCKFLFRMTEIPLQMQLCSDSCWLNPIKGDAKWSFFLCPDSTGNVIDLVKDHLPELQLSEEDRQKNLELLEQAKKVSDRFLTRRGRRSSSSLSESPTGMLGCYQSRRKKHVFNHSKTSERFVI